MISIMVYNIEVALRLIRENNGKVLQEPAAEARQKVALFADPTGNVFSLYQHGG
jgi:predicted enzyme related to lactoylglutathione lyase